jgi:chromosomal replication initiator protein
MDHDGPATAVARRIGERLAERIGHHTYDMWFGMAARLQVVGGCVRVDTDNPFVADWINLHFREALAVTAREALGDAAQVDLLVGQDGANGTPEAAAPPDRPRTRRRHGWKSVRSFAAAARLRRLEDYVVGSCNQLAFAAAQRIAGATEGARALYLYGECGVGKTHLLQGVSHAAGRGGGRGLGAGEARARYVTAEQFTNEYIGAVRGGGLDDFRRRMRRLDLLAVDDIQFLSNKTATQREFLHTVEALELANARLAIAADEHPTRLGFTPALASRLAAAMVARIDRPDRGLRIALLERLAASRGLRLSAAAADAIAARCCGAVRELEGALNKLAALSLLNGGGDGEPVGLVLVEQLFRDSGWRPRAPVPVEAVIETVCRRLSVARSDLMGCGRDRRVVAARGLVAYLSRDLTTLSFPEIAQALGRKHHSTVHTAATRVSRQLATPVRVDAGGGRSPLLSDLVDQLRHEILQAVRR